MLELDPKKAEHQRTDIIFIMLGEGLQWLSYNLLAMQETKAGSWLGEIPEEGILTHSSILVQRIHDRVEPGEL